MKKQVRYVIFDVHMGMGHDGLSEVIRMHKKKNPLVAKTLTLDPGLILFVNKDRTRCKMFAEDGEVLGYLSLKSGKITQRTLNLIPETFGGSVEYSKSAKKALESFLKSEEVYKKNSPIAKTVIYAQ